MILINGCIAKMLKACIVARGVRLENNDFGSVFGLVLKKNCAFQFGFNFQN